MPPKVLIVEDDLHTRRMLSLVLTRDRMLRYQHFEVLTAADGAEGLAMFCEHRPELLITDLLMPVMDGFELIAAVRALPWAKKTPILVTSAVIRNSSVLRRLELEHDVELQLKPFNPRQLADRVRRLLHGRGADVKTDGAPLTAAPAPALRSARPAMPPLEGRPRPASPPLAKEPAAAPRAERTTPGLGLADTRPAPLSAARVAPALERPVAAPATANPPAPAQVAAQAALAPAEERPGGALAGQVDAEHTVSALLIDLALEERSGTLDLRRDKQRKVIHLLGGHPIFVQSNLRSETLGQLLVRRGGLSEEQHQSALEVAQREKIKYGEALVRLGLMSEADVVQELVRQTRLKVQSCLRWPDAEWTFEADPEVGRRVPNCTIDPLETVLTGLRQIDAHQVLAQLFKLGPNRRFVLRSDRGHLLPRVGEIFGPVVFELLRRAPTLAEVLLGHPDVALAADALLCSGLAHLGEAEAPARARTVERARRAATAEAPALDSLVGESRSAHRDSSEEGVRLTGAWAAVGQEDIERRDQDRVARALVEAAYLGLHEKTHYEVLGVIRETDDNGIEVAYNIKRSHFDLARFRERDIGEAYAHLEGICAALDEAYRVLSDPQARQAYDETLGETPRTRSPAMAAEECFVRGMDLLGQGAAGDAMSCFERAIALDDQPEYRVQEAMAYFISEGQAADAGVEAMVRVQAALAADTEQPGAHIVAARISRTLGAIDEAIEHLRDALRIDALRREAFDELESILLEEQRLEELEAEYRRVIFRVGSRDRGWSAALWKRLVLLYRDRLQDLPRAHKACDAAFRLNPADGELRAVLQQLVASGDAGSWPQAVLGYRALLRNNPQDTTPLVELFQLHEAAQRPDAALIAARAALWRGADDPRLRELADRHGRGMLKVSASKLTPELWQLLCDPADDPILDGLFCALAPLIEARHPLTAEDLDLVDDAGAGLQTLSPDLSAVLRYVAEKLEVAPPRVIVRPELGADVQGAGTTPPLLLIGTGALAITDRRELAFRLGRALTLLTSARRLAGWRSMELLRDYLLAAVQLVLPQADVPATSPRVDAFAAEIDARPGMLASCQQWVLDLHDRGSELDLAVWQQGALRTADRVGLLLCTDLRVAGRIIAEVTPEAEGAVLDFALSESYARLRDRFGLAI